MTISSAMTTAVSALKAQSQALSVISNNLANSSTTGYKSVSTSFSSLVTQMYSGTNYNGAGVTSSARQNVSNQGTIEATSNNTDLALDGSGMFVVSYGNSGDSLYFTRDGEFDVDDNGYLVCNNYYLMGWPTDEDGTITGNTSSSSLTRINVTNNVSSVEATSKATIDADLGPNTDIAVATATSSKITTANSNDVSGLGISAGETFDVTTSDGTTTSYTVSDVNGDGTVTLDEIASSINNTTGANVTASVVSSTSGYYTLSLTPSTDNVTLTSITDTYGSVTEQLGLIDSSGTMANVSTTNTSTSTMEVYDTLGNSHTVTMTWAKTDTNEWSVSFASDDSTTAAQTFTLSFDSSGQLTSTPSTFDLSFDWGNGSDSSQVISVDMSSVTQTSTDDGVTQSSADADGHSAGKLDNVTVSEDGSVVASYDNGQTITLYKIAVATFPNYDGLTAMSNGVYQASATSGNWTLHEAGEGGAAVISSSSLESSTVDTADEFTKMIVAQQAYSAASQVITTAKDMFDSLIGAVR